MQQNGKKYKSHTILDALQKRLQWKVRHSKGKKNRPKVSFLTSYHSFCINPFFNKPPWKIQTMLSIYILYVGFHIFSKTFTKGRFKVPMKTVRLPPNHNLNTGGMELELPNHKTQTKFVPRCSYFDLSLLPQDWLAGKMQVIAGSCRVSSLTSVTVMFLTLNEHIQFFLYQF